MKPVFVNGLKCIRSTCNQCSVAQAKYCMNQIMELKNKKRQEETNAKKDVR